MATMINAMNKSAKTPPITACTGLDGKRYIDNDVLNRVHATLEVTQSVGWLVGRLINWSVGTSSCGNYFWKIYINRMSYFHLQTNFDEIFRTNLRFWIETLSETDEERTERRKYDG